ncbi:MAG: CHASE2 domain-containing protein [Candidatus Omnitrophica bacterium]|nr:CHASE2 domain-containing protein [Candidatus Omnitrophota bacterium]
MKIKALNKILVALAGLVGCLAIMAGSYFHILDSYELETLDLRFRARPQIPTTDKVVMIEVSDDTVEKIGRFPFDRSYHALLVKALSEAGAKAIVFDIFFSEPMKSDAEFVDAVKKAGNVYFPVVFDIEPGRRKVPYASGIAARNLEVLNSVSKGVGHINVVPDVDGKFRRVPAYIKYEGYLLQPYLSLLFACDHLGISQKDVKFVLGSYVDLGGVKIPLDEHSNIIVNFSAPWGRSYRHYSFVDVLQSYLAKVTGEVPNIDLGKLRGKVCIIGLTAVGTVDLHPNPFDALYPAMGMHADVFNSIVKRNFIARASRGTNLMILIVLSSLMSVLVLKTRPLKGFFMLVGIMTIFITSGILLFNLTGLWIDLIYPLVVGVILHIALTLYKYVREWKKRLLMESELQIAKKIQESFLPKVMPSIEGMDVAAAMFTARQVGGDLYDFTSFGEDRFGIMIGDVSGKGVPAALFMAMVVGDFRSFALPGKNPQEVLSSLNSKLIRESTSNLFVTVYYSIFDVRAKTMVYGNGGHLPVLYIAGDGSSRFLDVEEGSPLGLMEGEYSASSVAFEKGDIFIYYTDGITEAMNRHSDMYGKERLQAVALKNRGLSARKLLETIERDVRRFEPKSQQHDDMTIIVVKVL